MWSRTILAGTIDVLLGHIVKKPSKHELQQDNVKIHVLKRSDSPPEMYNDQFCGPEPFRLVLLMFSLNILLTKYPSKHELQVDDDKIGV